MEQKNQSRIAHRNVLLLRHPRMHIFSRPTSGRDIWQNLEVNHVHQVHHVLWAFLVTWSHVTKRRVEHAQSSVIFFLVPVMSCWMCLGRVLCLMKYARCLCIFYSNGMICWPDFHCIETLGH